ncbi:MAG: zinc ribbon domain-containing protein [Chlamydiae bacterium]|nr:zinc ribbon domain-containing protein [Chlamydiota bacterium]
MPTYSYHCEKCLHKFEAFQNINDETLKECPKCKAVSLKRGFGGGSATFQFKGDGFYVNDYKKGPKNPSCEGCKNSQKCS